jgi:hypothetical protein
MLRIYSTDQSLSQRMAKVCSCLSSKPILKYYLLFLFFLISKISFSQAVINDSINKRIKLLVNSGFYSSSTADCTVEWNCVQKEKLRSVITFHNDQWFSFSPKNQGDFYLNIKHQLCKANRGVQVLVIEGEACVPSTYEYLKLHSMLSTEDITYHAKDLEINKEYLISIDGLLGDQCSFEIGISDTVPTNVIHSLPIEIEGSSKREEDIIRLEWKANMFLADTNFRFIVYRKIGNAALKEIESYSNDSYTFGKHEKNFVKTDTLKIAEDYQYVIVGEANSGNKYLYKSFYFHNAYSIKTDSKFTYFFKSGFKGKREIHFKIINADNEQLLAATSEKNEQNRNYKLGLHRYYQKGIRRFRIVIDYNNDPGSRKSELFIID